MPRDIVESMRTHVLKGEDDGALRDGSAFESVRSLADAQEVREAGEWNVRARIATITKLVNQGRLDDAMNAVGEVATSETPEWGKDQAYDLLPRIADAAVTRMLKKKQFDDAIAYLDRADELAKDQPDIQARLQSLRDRVNTAIYGPNSTAWRRPEQLPKLVFVGDAPPESPDSACIRIENATDYRMRIVFAAAGETVRRQTYHIPARKTGKLVLAPGSYYEAASIPSEPGIRPFTGKLEVEKGTWRQGFEIRSQSEYVPVR
jgi:pterin-4a-carbinolamine dehydratase